MTIENAVAVAAALLAIAGVLIAIITSSQRRHQSKLELLRTAMERGVLLTPELIDRIMHPHRKPAGSQTLERGQGTRVAGIVVTSFGVGYAVLSGCIAIGSPDALLPMLGVTCLFLSTGVALLLVSRVLRSGGSAAEPGE
jgi:hypothetical protein